MGRSIDGSAPFPYSQSITARPEFAVSIKSFVLIGSALLASVAFAQGDAPSLGTVRNVEGLVTDTDGASVTSTEAGEAIHDRSEERRVGKECW